MNMGGDEEARNRGLTIGGCETAWLADLAMTHVLEKCKKHFKSTIFHGVYRDDGIVVTSGKWKKSNLVEWLENFQKDVDKK